MVEHKPSAPIIPKSSAFSASEAADFLTVQRNGAPVEFMAINIAPEDGLPERDVVGCRFFADNEALPAQIAQKALKQLTKHYGIQGARIGLVTSVVNDTKQTIAAMDAKTAGIIAADVKDFKSAIEVAIRQALGKGGHAR